MDAMDGLRMTTKMTNTDSLQMTRLTTIIDHQQTLINANHSIQMTTMTTNIDHQLTLINTFESSINFTINKLT